MDWVEKFGWTCVFLVFRSDVRPSVRSRAGAMLVALLALPRREDEVYCMDRVGC